MLRKAFVHQGALHTQAEGITFSLYSAEEIKKLSVVNIVTPLSFNALGHPLPGGLYDPAMGPYDMGGMCLTCQQSFMFCPGHFGRIELPLPVINPLFSKTLLQIFRMSCLGCRSFTISGALRHKCITKLKLLSFGLVKEAQDADSVMSALQNEGDGKKKTGNNSADNELAKLKFEEYFDRVMSKRKASPKVTISSKNVESIRQSVVKELLSEAKMSHKCNGCGLICKKMMLFESRILYTLSSAKSPRQSKEEMEEQNFVDNILGGSIGIDTATASGILKYLTPSEAKDHMRMIWMSDPDLLRYLFPVLTTTSATFPTDLFFVDVVAVPPPKNRAAKMLNNQTMEHPQNLALRHVVTSCTMLTYASLAMKNGTESLSIEALKALKGVMGNSLNEKLETIWKDLQADVDHVMDREKSKISAAAASQMIGLKQVIEKKEGLFRMHMMGKRVNYAARTVITPDPNIHIEEIGIPDVFAKVLTFPTQVTTWNVHHLRKLILNGPNVHPGAVAVENELGQVSRLDPNSEVQRKGVANRLLSADKITKGRFSEFKTVHRHLMNGDLLLLNRQPSLHRPSIMAHKARVLYGDKVFRLHYANCKHYNADFDGDEMNAHFPQTHVARSEAANLVNVCSHFLVPKDGTPLSGLIQDHVVAGVRLTLRGRFFNRQDYHQLVHFAIGSYAKEIITEPPTIMCRKLPKEILESTELSESNPNAKATVTLWSGKQVISTVIKNLVPPGRAPLSFTSSAKIKADEWRQCDAQPWKAGGPISGDDMSESAVIFRHGELLSGVLDKVHLGATPYGLIHAFYELYGNEAAGALLTAFSRLMTNFLQWEGFTLGVKDVLVTAKADELRRHFMIEASKVGPKAAAAGVNLSADAPEELVAEKLEQVHRSRDNKSRAFVDLCYKKSLDQYTNQINKSCLPYGLVAIFPQNNLQLLVQSGAKGSTVNTMQMSCALGQIELEGKRPPLSVSGKSLPSFKMYDVSPRAGGFIAGRFLTGIRPQEFFFHCMAGREGLIDTAVKTSRSGYLQRCLVKLLEGVVTQYDGTVRDSDGSVIQFLYGEDGLDVCKSQYLKAKQLKFLEENSKGVLNERMFRQARNIGNQSEIRAKKDRLSEWIIKNGPPTNKTRQGAFLEFSKVASRDKSIQHLNELSSITGRSAKTEKLCEMWLALSPAEQAKYYARTTRCPDPVMSTLRPDSNFSVVSEILEKVSGGDTKETGKQKRFQDVVFYKAMTALSVPGDAVGVLAAQSVGEPSTQMTLNTFHFAGRGEMNVTLGIPRLREILMVASANIKTPSMDIPFLSHVSEKRAEKLRLKLTSVNLAQVLQYVAISERIDATTCSRIYKLNFNFLAASEYNGKFCVKPANILSYVEKSFFRHKLLPFLRKASKQKKDTSIQTLKDGKADFEIDDEENEPEKRRDLFEEQEKKGMGEGHESSDEEPEAEDADATQATRMSRHTEAGYDEPEEEEKIVEDEEVDEDAKVLSSVKKENDESDDEGEGDNNKDAKTVFRVSTDNYEARVSTVSSMDEMIIDYDFDRVQEEWCTVTLRISLAVEKVNMGSVLRDVAVKSMIHQVPNITRAFLVNNGDKLTLKTEGINILALASYRDLLDLNRLHCNNIHTMAEHYGIEAASRVIVKEMTDVFKAYGIVIDPRHLSLIAEFMTFSGTYRPFNRIGIESSASPLQQMSFETVVTFLRDAALTGKYDDLSSPSSRLVVGKPVAVGTGLFTLRQKLNSFEP